MGLDPKNLPEAVLSKIDKKDRPGVQTAAEAGQVQAERLERDEQRLFAKWLNLQESKGLLFYDWQRTDKRATGRKGRPDFIVCLANHVTVFIEFKASAGRFTGEQVAKMGLLESLGYRYVVARTAAEAIEILKQYLLE